MDKKDTLNWDHVRYFVAVVKAGTVVGGAKLLGVSHATVLRNVSRLEDYLGIRLFDHVRSGYRITAEGEAIYADALGMQERAEALTRRAMGKDPAPEGSFKLVISDSSLFDPMPLLKQFRRAFPRIDLSVGPVTGPEDKSIAELKADVALVVTDAPPEDLVGRQLARINFAAFASADYLNEQRSQSEGADIDPGACDWITWGEEVAAEAGLHTGWQQNVLRRLAGRPRIVLHTADHRDALAAVQAGVGAGLLCDLPQPGLVALPFSLAIEPFGLWILTHPDLRRAGRVRAFMDFAAENFRAG